MFFYQNRGRVHEIFHFIRLVLLIPHKFFSWSHGTKHDEIIGKSTADILSLFNIIEIRNSFAQS